MLTHGSSHRAEGKGVPCDSGLWRLIINSKLIPKYVSRIQTLLIRSILAVHQLIPKENCALFTVYKKNQNHIVYFTFKYVCAKCVLNIQYIACKGFSTCTFSLVLPWKSFHVVEMYCTAFYFPRRTSTSFQPIFSTVNKPTSFWLLVSITVIIFSSNVKNKALLQIIGPLSG